MRLLHRAHFFCSFAGYGMASRNLSALMVLTSASDRGVLKLIVGYTL